MAYLKTKKVETEGAQGLKHGFSWKKELEEAFSV